MSSKDSLSILEVLENLNTLVDADSLDEIEVTERGVFISHKAGGTDKDIYWIKAGANLETLTAIKDTFRLIHKYLISFYKKMKEGGNQKRMVEGINTIMVLVGEAEKKLEKFDRLFREKIPKLEEYKNLQNFYHNHVIKETFKEFSKTPIQLAPSVNERIPNEQEWEEEFDELIDEEREAQEIEGIHLLNDIEVVKNDTLYELFYVKNEAGHNFYTPDLARTIKLACDFGQFEAKYFGDDPLLQIKNWEDKSLHLLAKRILRHSQKSIEKFYKESAKYREVEIVATLQKALSALMIAANPRTLIRQVSLKGSHLYFRDFQIFLRSAIENREYQRFLVYSPPASTTFFGDCLALIHELAYHLVIQGPNVHELEDAICKMTKKNPPSKSKKVSEFLHFSDLALRQVLSAHPSGPVFKALDIVRENEEKKFDPFLQANVPTFEGSIKINERENIFLRLPCPTIQEYIDHATIDQEFKAFLYACAEKKDPFHLLLFNFQDRTSWKEHARCKAIEELERLAEFSKVLTVVTFTKESDFYNQQGVYHTLSNAKDFTQHFLEHLQDENTGYYFPSKLKKELFPEFAEQLLNRIWEVFFDSKADLSMRQRLDFIELAYHFLELKILEKIPSSFISFTSKDALDIGGTSIIGLMALLAIGQGKKWQEEELESVCRTLFGPTLLHRERAIHRERFERLDEMIRLIEEKKDFLSQFGTLFNNSTLEAHPRFYKENAEE